jgi:hypothetical protein
VKDQVRVSLTLFSSIRCNKRFSTKDCVLFLTQPKGSQQKVVFCSQHNKGS